MRSTAYLLLLVLAAAAAVSAQTTSAEITGKITDSTGAAVPRASIVASNLDTGTRRETESNEAGVYAVPSLPPGRYKVVVQKQGFKPMSRSEITLVVDQVARVDFGLELGSLSETVEVKAEAPLLDQETSSLGQVIDSSK